MDFLQQVGAEISLTAHSLFIGHCSFSLKRQGHGASETQRLITDGQTEPLGLDRVEREVELVGDWEGTVELAGAVTVPPLCKDSPVSSRSTER